MNTLTQDPVTVTITSEEASQLYWELEEIEREDPELSKYLRDIYASVRGKIQAEIPGL